MKIQEHSDFIIEIIELAGYISKKAKEKLASVEFIRSKPKDSSPSESIHLLMQKIINKVKENYFNESSLKRIYHELIDFNNYLDKEELSFARIQSNVEYIYNLIDDIDKKHLNDLPTDALEEIKKINAQAKQWCNQIEAQYRNSSRYHDEMEEYASHIKREFDFLKELKTELSGSKNLIDEFRTRIRNGEERLDSVDSKLKSYNNKLEGYEKEHKNKMVEAEKVLSNAKNTLSLATSYTLSSAFDKQWDIAKKAKVGGWLIGAIICLSVTIAVGIWIAWGNDDLPLNKLIARITLLPFGIVGAAFCAQQYRRQKDIIEDYAYKKVLAQAMEGFTDILKKHETEKGEYSEYVKMTLEEIHKDPLNRKKTSSEPSQTEEKSKIEELTNQVSDLSKLLKELKETGKIIKP